MVSDEVIFFKDVIYPLMSSPSIFVGLSLGWDQMSRLIKGHRVFKHICRHFLRLKFLASFEFQYWEAMDFTRCFLSVYLCDENTGCGNMFHLLRVMNNLILPYEKTTLFLCFE